MDRLFFLGACVALVACSPPPQPSALRPPVPALTPPPVTRPSAAADPLEPSPPPSADRPTAAARTFEPREPVEHEIGEHHLVLTFGSTKWASSIVSGLTLDGISLWPHACGPRDTSGLCSPAHRAVREAHGEQLLLVDSISQVDATDGSKPSRVELFFAAVFVGSPECGAYGFWSMRVDRGVARISNPIAGCFLGAQPKQDDQPAVPKIEWGSPTTVRVQSPSATSKVSFQILELDDKSYQWRVLRQGGDWGM